MENNQLIEILRIRYFLEHNHKQITNIESELTIKSNKKDKDLDNIFLELNNFSSNLKVIDSEGTEYPIMRNKDTITLLEIMNEKEKSENIASLIQDIKNMKRFVIWIKIPPNKKLQSNEIRVMHIFYDTTKINERSKHIFIYISSSLPFPIFWIFKKPNDYNITKQNCYTIKDKKLTNKKSWKDIKNDLFYYTNTTYTSTVFVRSHQTDLILSYSFKPQAAIITIPTASIVLLVSFSLFLIIVQNFGAGENYGISSSLVEDVLERRIELSLFIISLSIIIPRFIANVEIRHSYFWLWFVPIALAIVFFLGIDFNGMNTIV